MKLFPTFLSCLLTLAPVIASAESVDELIKQGDQHAQSYQEEDALKHYLAAIELDERNAYVHLAVSREYRHLMTDAKSKSEKLKYANIALDYANKAAKLGPTNSDAQLAPAITYGKLLPLIPDSGERLKISRKIKASADRAIKLNPRNDTAWNVLGRWHRGFAELSGTKRFLGGLVHGNIPKSTYANAAACFRNAIDINPNRLMHHVELGCIYSSMGKKKDARKLIKRGLAMAETEKDDPETKRRGKDLLSRL